VVARMRWIAVLVVFACVGRGPKPDLSSPYPCGKNTCTANQLCETVEAGSQCDVDLDAGIPPYGIASQTCVDLPAACDGYPSNECICGNDDHFCHVSGRDISRECI
jgi:hypothetical protein